jgi:hypothetical protein
VGTDEQRPQWRVSKGNRLLDFARSYAAQIVPSIFSSKDTVLLQGRLAILKVEQYEDINRARRLASLYRKLTSSMKNSSDHQRVVVQNLSTGKTKTWNDILLGREVPDSLRLKQFANGPVVFDVVSVQSTK